MMSYLVKKVAALLRPYLRQEILGVFLTVLYSFSVFLVPLASQYLIDEVIPAKSMEKLACGLLAFSLVCVAQPLIGYGKDRVFVKITENITRDIRNSLFERIVYADFHFLNQAKGGDLISIIMNDGRSASDFISTVFATLLQNTLMIVMIIVGMFMISWDITLTVFFLFLVYYLFNVTYGKKIQQVSENIQENYDSLCSCVNQTNRAILSIKTYNQEEASVHRFHQITSKMRGDNIQIDTMSLRINHLSMVAVSICLAIIYGWGAVKVMSGALTLGEVIAMGLYFQLLNQPFFELMNVGINTNVIIPIFKRIEKYQKLEQERVGVNEGPIAFEQIVFSDVSCSYEGQGGNPALRHISVVLPAKGMVCVTGESGSGKSTFAKLLLGVLNVEQGMIFMGDRDICDISLATLRANISYVPQDADILNDTIYQNIRFGSEYITNEDIREVCGRLRLDQKIESLEKGYDSLITERVNLSGGERQRILIARGILKHAPVLILDEPLSSLDAENVELVTEILTDIARERLVILITHSLCGSLTPDMNIIFDDGRAKTVDTKEKRPST